MILAAIIATIFVFRLVEGLDVNLRKGLAAIVGIGAALGLAYLLLQGAIELWFISNSVGTGSIGTTIGSAKCISKYPPFKLAE